MSKRQVFSYPFSDLQLLKRQLIGRFDKEPYFFYLNSNQTDFEYKSFETLIGIGCLHKLQCNAGNAFDKLEQFQNKHKDWLFGWLGYDLKNELENLTSVNTDALDFPDLCFVIPKTVLSISDKKLHIYSFAAQDEVDKLFQEIKEFQNHSFSSIDAQSAHLISGFTKSAYLSKAETFLNHIRRGDIYEANFCTQFRLDNVKLDATRAYTDLNTISEPPFSALVRAGEYHCVSASPERYLKKTGDRIISQPIKGTARRFDNLKEDQKAKDQLLKDPKERSENVMIVDLVRNDLSKTAVKGSVQVDELYGIYSFKQVHHMISTISSELDEAYSGLDAIKSTFPMGSMTGAPKVSAMKIIDKNENFKRGLYSGAIGYFSPDGDFDFNVVIRSILYNDVSQKLSMAVGSALTVAADPEKEYNECLLKAKALFETLKLQMTFKTPSYD